MVEKSRDNFLELRHQSARDTLRAHLLNNDDFEEVSSDNIHPFLKSATTGWRTTIQAINKEWLVDIGLPNRFPDTPPIACVHNWEELFLRNPHVLKDGFLCVIPDSAAINSNDPVSLFHYVNEKAKEVLEGTDSKDFKDEFSYYWGRCSTEGAQSVLLIDSVGDLEKEFPVVFCKGYVCVASSLSRLNQWVTNYIGKPSDLENERIGIRLDLESPLIPTDYPDTLEDLLSLAEVNDPRAEQLIKNNLIQNKLNALVLLAQKEGAGIALGGLIYNGLGLAQAKDFTKGFRPGKIPPNLLFSRAQRLIHSTIIKKCKVTHVDHEYIHSRGGDGRNFSQKKVLLIGCGSLGGYVAHLLSRAGIGYLTVTDNDILGWENVGRHVLGASYLGRWKAEAMSEALIRELPHLNIVGIPKDWRDIYEENQNIFDEHDLVISTVADWRCEGPLNALKLKHNLPPLLFGWLEPHAVAGHCLVISEKGGCFECGTNQFGQFDQHVANFEDSTIIKEPGGCIHYQRYGPTALMPVASLITNITIECLLADSIQSNLYSWISSKEHMESAKANISPCWQNNINEKGYSKTFKNVWPKSKTCQLCN